MLRSSFRGALTAPSPKCIYPAMPIGCASPIGNDGAPAGKEIGREIDGARRKE
jgi:hypothetical protein